MDKYSELMNLEYKIAQAYNDLINIECRIIDFEDNANEKINLSRKLYIELLKELLLEEEKMIKNLSMDKLAELKFIYNTEDNVLINNILKRITVRVVDKDYKGAGVIEFMNAIHDDYWRLYLSFVDENLEIEEDNEISKKLVEEKYKRIYQSNFKLEKDLIETNFIIPKTVTLESMFISQIYDINEEIYNGLKYEIVTGKFEEICSDCNLNEDKSLGDLLYLCGLYTLFLLLTENELKDLLDEEEYEDLLPDIQEMKEKCLKLSLYKND